MENINEIKVESQEKSKQCCKCKIIKTVKDFCKNRHKLDGLNIECRDCAKIRKAKLKENINPEKRIARKHERNGFIICPKCKERKTLNNFTYDSSIDYYRNYCNLCHNTKVRKKRVRTSESYGRTLDLDKEREWKKCTSCNNILLLNNFCFQSNIQKFDTKCLLCKNKRIKKYREANKQKLSDKRKLKRLKTFGLYNKMTKGIRRCLGRNKGGVGWLSLVPYTLEELKSHIESLFTDGMNWNLFYKGKIQIDHKLPNELFTYQFPTDTEFKLCWALNNLQPLWAVDNAQKCDTLPNGIRARDLSIEEKRKYLIFLGFDIN